MSVPLPVAGVRLAAVTAGLKESGRPDVALIEFLQGSRTAALFTRNAFCAAPVRVARAHLAAADPRLFVINSGCANAGTGSAGEADAEATCRDAGKHIGVEPAAVLPFSTGVIGPRLDLECLLPAVERGLGQLEPDGWAAAAQAIMTTDTRPKIASRTVALSGGEVTMTGMAKGAGMIRPDMATLLAFVATDATIDADALHDLLVEAADASFHSITVDGDTSTNDALTLTATGASGVGIIHPDDRRAFLDALRAVCVELAREIVRDAEGATRLIEIDVEGARDRAEARAVAFTVAHSPLFKTAAAGGDPNWGRILAAVGRAPVDALDASGVDIELGGIPLVVGGEPVAGYDEIRAAAVMAQEEIPVRIGLGRGSAGTRVWTSDLTCDYVRINADYRT